MYDMSRDCPGTCLARVRRTASRDEGGRSAERAERLYAEAEPMRRGDAQHRRAARKRTIAYRQEARELSSRAFPAKRAFLISLKVRSTFRL